MLESTPIHRSDWCANIVHFFVQSTTRSQRNKAGAPKVHDKLISALGSRAQGLVFSNEHGGIINPSKLCNRYFKRLLERAGLPPIRLHDLRHTCATLLLSRNGNPKIVSEMLGHSFISITLDTYSHVLPTMQENAVRALEDTLN